MHEPSVAESVDSLVARVSDEFVERQRRGERPDVEEYVARHPEHAEVLRPVLVMLALAGPALSGVTGEAGAVQEDAVSGTLGDFRILREVGRGGMGVVYEAEQISLRRRVALKVLPFAATMDPRRLQRFRNEAYAAASLHHEHIVPVHAVGCERGLHFYAMQLIDGRTLAEVIVARRGGKEPDAECTVPYREASPSAATAAALSTVEQQEGGGYYREVARLGIEAALALEHAHSVGVVHRDVKPANLMLDGRGKLWVTDFGLAQLSGEPGVTMTGDLLGTLRYMSPEQAMARHGLVDHRTDIYSLGATLYELLALRPAFGGKDRQEVLKNIAFEEPVSPRKVDSSIPVDLETVVLKAMAKNPRERYATAKELADDLQRWREDRAVKARRPSLAQKLSRLARRHKVLAWSVGSSVTAVVLILALAAGYVVRDRQSRRAETALRAEVALDETERLYRQGRWAEALEAARRTRQLLPPEEAGWLGQRAQQWLVDLGLVGRLAEIRLRSGDVGDAVAAARRQADEYDQALREHGLEVWEGKAEEVAQQVRRSAVRDELVAALDDWAGSQHVTRQGDGERWKRLLAIARVADPDDLRNRVRAALEKRDGPALLKLAAGSGGGELPLTTRRLLANALTSVRCMKEAMAQLQQAHQQAPGDFWVNYDLAFAYSNAAQPRGAEALRHYSAALAVRPGSARVRVNLAAVLIRARQLDEAAAYCQQAIALQPSLTEAHFNLGLCHARRGRRGEAIAAYQEALRHRPDYVAAHVNLGRALRDSGRFDEAVESCNRAIQLDPTYAAAYETVGQAYLRAGKPDRAVSALATFLRLHGSDGPGAAPAHNNLAVALSRTGKQDGAIAAYRKAIRMDPALDGPRPNLASLLLQQWKPDEAIQVLEEDLRHKPDRASSHLGLGTAFDLKGMRAEATAAYRRAIPLYEQAVKGNSDDPVLLNNLARLLTTIDDPRLRDPRRAVQLAGRAVKLNPKEAACWQTLGIARFRSGDWQQAEEALEKAIELHHPKPLTPEQMLYYAMALWRIGNQADARETYQVAAEKLGAMKTCPDGLVRLRAEAAALLGIKEPRP